MNPSRTRLLTRWLAIGGLLAGLALATGLAWQLALQRAMAAEALQSRQQLQLYAQALRQLIDRYRTLPRVLALDPDLRAALRVAPDAAQRQALDLKLERANTASHASTLTLIGHDGVAIAASNWRMPGSNVGEDYSFRPYVRQALEHGEGRFYGIGLTTNRPGYFLSRAITGPGGAPLGLVVIKIELDTLEREWLQVPDTVLVSDDHGVVFLASNDRWRYRTLHALDAQERAELAATRQYAGQALAPLPMQRVRPLAGQVDQVRMDGHDTLLWATMPLAENGWQLHLLHDPSAATAVARNAALATAGAWLALCFLGLFVVQRRRTAALRQRSRTELETVLRQHAQELRTAKDGIVEAARQADVGLSRSLEHLPQGVVIIDAALNLVAWNSRYADLFRFPDGLLQVGRPIEDVFRFNARRGLLGPGPIEEAIGRRLDHLRSGKPHMRESEKDDGTVLEIRGNPLPDGGFVTSYADITSYKNAARELRSLADALELRVAQRTADLDQARHQAEEASRYKSRFVASTVHDLMQPLNAARMFASLLHGHPDGERTRQALEGIEGALSSQDAILSGLLDIARLESGTLQPRIGTVALGPLLDTLGREFGILAQGRGLHLACVPTTLQVRSDAVLLRRILQNFLSNAVRYTARGGVLLGCRRRGALVRIEVRDTGPGIPPNRQQEVFQEFCRLDDGGSGGHGAGLGLAIVERSARLLGHRIGLQSQPGRGSVFWIEVPRVPQGTDTAPAPQPAPGPGADDDALAGRVVWCIDDDAQVCQACRTVLERWGCQVPLAAGAGAALAAAQPGQAPALVLLDLPLGQADGAEVFEALCARWQARPAVILVSASREPVRGREWPVLPKPVRPAALRALMTQVLLRGD